MPEKKFKDWDEAEYDMKLGTVSKQVRDEHDSNKMEI